VAAFADDLAALPVDGAVLDAAIDGRPSGAPALDLGCGPGQVAEYLHRRGVPCIGLDLAPRMLVQAGDRTRGPVYCGGDMRSLPFGAGSLSAVVAFYSVQHLPRSDLSTALAEAYRVLIPGGLVVVATHLGEGLITLDEFLGHAIEPMGGTFYRNEELGRSPGGQLLPCGTGPGAGPPTPRVPLEEDLPDGPAPP
jgi:ubiquinone/menaquinone biosynthesis C-methylase UbiE